jgi:hypothetical protein
MASKKFKRKTCAYCGIPGSSASREHVFVREFFLERHRHNLPEVPACKPVPSHPDSTPSPRLLSLYSGACGIGRVMANQTDIDDFHHCDLQLPEIRAKQLKRITGKQHRTYQSGVQGLLAAKFSGSGNYWATFLVGRSLNPFPEEHGNRELIGAVAELFDNGGIWRLLRFVWPVRRSGSN